MEPKSIDRIFWDAAQMTSAGERDAYLTDACADNAELRQRIEQLLQAKYKAESFLESPAPNLAATINQPSVSEGPGMILGAYKLLEQIGEGGFGIVFMAEQQHPVRRKVALKVLKAGMDTRQVIARFEAERQALALMDHPNIARVFDGGEASAGRPYFVMELVKGIPVTDYCDQGELATRDRLELFIHVCQAVQHAHQKGIIHRDLKPSNVLVTLHDGVAVAKVIDFGIAKATGQQLTDKTLFTNFAQLVGTPLYMSPEQAALSGLDVDTRSDVYSLGVLLYELLTSTTPFDKERFKAVGYDEMRRIIREEEPPRPSTRVARGEGRGARETAGFVSSRPSSLASRPSEELDWIVMKCLEKDRNRRYETADGLARDIRRYLRDEPVQACPPSAWYRFRKFVRRNEARLAIAGLIVLFVVLLVAAIGWVVWDGVAREQEVARALDETLTLHHQKRWPEALEVAKRAEGIAGGGGSAALRQRLRELRKDLDMVLLLEDIHLRGSDVKDGHFTDLHRDPDYEEAFRTYGIDVLGPDARDTIDRLRATSIPVELAAALDDWAMARRRGRKDDTGWKDLLALARAADPDPWRNQLRDALERGDAAVLREMAASDRIAALPPSTLIFLGQALRDAGAVEQATALLRQAQQLYPADFWINHEMAYTLTRLKPPQWEQAIRFYTATVALRPRSPGVYVNLGVALREKGAIGEAVAAYKAAVGLKRDYAEAHCNLSEVLNEQGESVAAEAAARQALAVRRDYARGHACLGLAFLWQGRLPEAEAACRKAIALRPELAWAYGDLAAILHAQRRLPEAETACRKAIALAPELAMAHNNLAAILHDRGKLPEADAAYRHAIALEPELVLAHNNLALNLRAQRKLPEAEAACRKAIQIRPGSAVAYSNLGMVLQAQRRLSEAEVAGRKAVELRPDLPTVHNHLGFILHDRGKLPEAEAAFRKAIQIRPGFAEAHGNLGNVLYDQKKPGAAEAACRKAIALWSEFPEAHAGLGNALFAQGKLPDAEAACRKAVELRPNLAPAHFMLGKALMAQGKLPAAEAAYRKAIELRPKDADAHCNLGQVLQARGTLAEAEAEYRKAIALRPDLAEAHCNLGGLLQAQGQLAAAVAELRRGHELGSRQRGWQYPSARWLREAERLAALDAKLPAVLRGEVKPADAQEQLALAQLCQQPSRRLHAASARLYAAAFVAQPRLADDVPAGHRYNAACAAVLAGCGHAANRPAPDDKERCRWRQQALAWLRADLAWWRRRAAGSQRDRAAVRPVLQHWLADTDLDGVRGEPALARLPEAERDGWRRLWADVAKILGMPHEKVLGHE